MTPWNGNSTIHPLASQSMSERLSATSGVDGKLLGLPILFDSLHEIIVVKPARMATELTSDPKGTSLISRVRSASPMGVVPRLPHRIDRVGRGIVVVALTDKAIAFHNEQIRERQWEKIYLAKIHTPSKEEARHLIGRHKLHLRTVKGRAEVVRSGGKRAILEVLTVRTAPKHADQSHAIIRLLTGRYHQVRATMAYLGAPLVGDRLYGRSGDRESAFYLEHTALRFTPFGSKTPVVVHQREDPDRVPVDPKMQAELDAVILGMGARGSHLGPGG